MVEWFRRVIRITAEDSPNVRRARVEQAAGLVPTDTVIVPGVLTWGELQHRRATWDKIRQCVGLDAEFYEGTELLLFPPEWLNRAEQLFLELDRQLKATGRIRRARAIGIDPAEGGDRTAMCAGDELGIIELVSRKTPNTDDVVKEARAFMRKHGVGAEFTCFDRGGGGKQHADRMRACGCPVRTVAFGESLVGAIQRQKKQFTTKVAERELRTTFADRRTEMYWELSERFDASLFPKGFAIPPGRGPLDHDAATRLRHQLSVMPKLYDDDGVCRMLHKSRPKMMRVGDKPSAAAEPTLIELIGHSPDEADSVVLMLHAMTHRAKPAVAGAVT